MNKVRIIILLLIKLICLNTNAQYVYEQDTLCANHLGVQTKVIDYLPIELCFTHLKNNGFSYLVRLSYVSPWAKDAMNYNLFENLGVGGGSNFEHNKTMHSYSIKTGVMLWRFYDNYFGSRYISLNGTCTYAINKFTLTNDDPIYGRIITDYNENNIYSSIELEVQKITRYRLSFGLIVGYKILNPTPFSSIVKGIENETTYSPGTGFGSKIYFNIQIGYHFKFKRKQKT